MVRCKKNNAVKDKDAKVRSRRKKNVEETKVKNGIPVEDLYIRVYQYGCYVTENKELAVEQMRLAHRYRNKLCELDRKKRENLLAADRAYSDALTDIEAKAAKYKEEIAKLESDLNQVRATSRKTVKAETRMLRGDIKSRKSLLKVLEVERKQLRAALRQDPTLKARRVEIYDAFEQSHKEARGSCEVFWGTYQNIERALENWKEIPMPQFRRWRGDGLVGTQLQRDPKTHRYFTVEDAFAGTDNRLRLAYVKCPLRSDTPNRRREIWVRASVRIASTSPGNKPIFAVAVFKLSRPFPPKAIITWCYIGRTVIGSRDEWSIKFTISTDQNPHPDASPVGMCALDLGWRMRPNGDLRSTVFVTDRKINNKYLQNLSPILRDSLRVWDDGCSGELVIPVKILARLKHADQVKGTRDKMFNAARDTLADWVDGREFQGDVLIPFLLAQQENVQTARNEELEELFTRHIAAIQNVGRNWPGVPVEIPQWLREALARKERSEAPDPSEPEEKLIIRLRRWRSAHRLAGVVDYWRQNRFENDEDIFAFLEAWSSQNQHLWDYYVNVLYKTTLYRLHLYRNFAAWMRKICRTVVLEDTDWSDFMRKLPKESDDLDIPSSRRRQARLSAPGTLSAICCMGFPKHVKVPPQHTTQTCHICGEINAFDAAKNLHHTCTACGSRWDQDRNAACNLLYRGHAATR